MEIILLTSISNKLNYKCLEFSIKKNILKATGAVAYIVTRKGMKKILDTFFKQDTIVFDKEQIDDLGLSNINIDSGIWSFMETYYTTIPYFLPDNSFSDSTFKNDLASQTDKHISVEILKNYLNHLKDEEF